MSISKIYDLALTTQGPTYPPSEVMDEQGNFIVIGRVNRRQANGQVTSTWSRAIVAADSELPVFGENAPYSIIRDLPDRLSAEDEAIILHTLPLPLPCNNYPMVFAPDQQPQAMSICRPSYAFHQTPIPDFREIDGRKINYPITLGLWCKAQGQLRIEVSANRKSATFSFEFSGLIPDSLYTLMSLRQRDLAPVEPTRPGPLGVPNGFFTDEQGCARYSATLPNPFPAPDSPGANRVVNVVLLWMSYQMNCGGAIGWFGLGGDIHAQLKLTEPSFFEFETQA